MLIVAHSGGDNQIAMEYAQKRAGFHGEKAESGGVWPVYKRAVLNCAPIAYALVIAYYARCTAYLVVLFPQFRKVY